MGELLEHGDLGLHSDSIRRGVDCPVMASVASQALGQTPEIVEAATKNVDGACAISTSR